MNDWRDRRETEDRFRNVHQTFFLVIAAFLIVLVLWVLARVLAP